MQILDVGLRLQAYRSRLAAGLPLQYLNHFAGNLPRLKRCDNDYRLISQCYTAGRLGQPPALSWQVCRNRSIDAVMEKDRNYAWVTPSMKRDNVRLFHSPRFFTA